MKELIHSPQLLSSIASHLLSHVKRTHKGGENLYYVVVLSHLSLPALSYWMQQSTSTVCSSHPFPSTTSNFSFADIVQFLTFP